MALDLFDGVGALSSNWTVVAGDFYQAGDGHLFEETMRHLSAEVR